jgi:hypothetical protein
VVNNVIQRVFDVRPGYDCRKECTHKCKGAHGIHCDEWVYTVVSRDHRAALALEVYTPFYPPTVNKRSILEVRKPFSGGWLCFHYGFATTKEQVQDPESRGTDNCAYIGKCWTSGSALNANALVDGWFENNSEGAWPNGPGNQLETQPNLWLALEKSLAEYIDYNERERREDGDLKWVQCKHCAGEGVEAL